MIFNLAPLETRRDVAILGLIHRTVLGCGPRHFASMFRLSPPSSFQKHCWQLQSQWSPKSSETGLFHTGSHRCLQSASSKGPQRWDTRTATLRIHSVSTTMPSWRSLLRRRAPKHRQRCGRRLQGCRLRGKIVVACDVRGPSRCAPPDPVSGRTPSSCGGNGMETKFAWTQAS